MIEGAVQILPFPSSLLPSMEHTATVFQPVLLVAFPGLFIEVGVCGCGVVWCAWSNSQVPHKCLALIDTPQIFVECRG